MFGLTKLFKGWEFTGPSIEGRDRGRDGPLEPVCETVDCVSDQELELDDEEIGDAIEPADSILETNELSPGKSRITESARSNSMTLRGAEAAVSLPYHPNPSSDISGEVLVSFPRARGFAAKWQECTLTFASAKTSIMVFGATGEGKTASIAIPLLYRLQELSCPGLVLDIVKSDFANLCRRFENAIILGPADDSTPVNLIAGWDEGKLKEFLKASGAVGSGADNFWGSEGVTDAGLIFAFVKDGLERTATLVDIYDYFMDPMKLVRDVGSLMLRVKTGSQSHIVSRIVARVRGPYIFSIFHVGLDRSGLSDFNDPKPDFPMRKSGGNQDSNSQFAWHSSRILTLLAPFAIKPKIRATLCNSAAGGLDMKDLIYRKNKIIVLDMPSVTYGECATLVGQILRMEYRDAVIAARDIRAELGYGTRRFSFILMDEYQRYATGIGSAHGSADEANWSDISREFGNINIYLTQSVSSLVTASGSEVAVDTVVQNCRNLIFLPTFDERTLRLIQTVSLSAPGCRDRMLDLAPEREAFVYFARGAQDGGSAMGLCKTRGSRFRHMQIHHAEDLLSKPPYWSDDSFDSLAPDDSQIAPIDTDNLRIIVITTNVSHDGYIDFATEVELRGFSISRVFGMPPKGLPESRLRRALERYRPVARYGDVLAIVRGGGDRSMLTMFDSVQACSILDELKSLGVMVVTGVGHTKDEFAIDLHATHVGRVPLHAAQIVVNEMQSRDGLGRIESLYENLMSITNQSGRFDPTDDACLIRLAEYGLASDAALKAALACIDQLASTPSVLTQIEPYLVGVDQHLENLSDRKKDPKPVAPVDGELTRKRQRAKRLRSSFANLSWGEQSAESLRKTISEIDETLQSLKAGSDSLERSFGLNEPTPEPKASSRSDSLSPDSSDDRANDADLTPEASTVDYEAFPYGLIAEDSSSDIYGVTPRLAKDVQSEVEGAVETFDRFISDLCNGFWANPPARNWEDLLSRVEEAGCKVELTLHESSSIHLEGYMGCYVTKGEVSVRVGSTRYLLGDGSEKFDDSLKARIWDCLRDDEKRIHSELVRLLCDLQSKFERVDTLDALIPVLDGHGITVPCRSVLAGGYIPLTLRYRGKVFTGIMLPLELREWFTPDLIWASSEGTRETIYAWSGIEPTESLAIIYDYVRKSPSCTNFNAFIAAMYQRGVYIKPSLSDNVFVKSVRYLHRNHSLLAAEFKRQDAGWRYLSRSLKFRPRHDLSLFSQFAAPSSFSEHPDRLLPPASDN